MAKFEPAGFEGTGSPVALNGGRDSYGPLVTAVSTIALPTAAAHFAIPEQGVEFSAAALQIIAFLLGALAAVVVVLFRLYVQSLMEWKRLALRGTDVVDKALSVAQSTKEGP